MTTRERKIVLVVAGSDPSAGAGLQADLKTVSSLGGYAMTAATAITIQDTCTVYHVYPLPAAWVAQQMRTCLTDMGADCIKLGMLGNRATVLSVAEVLSEWPDIPVVADPVLVGTGGGTLLDHEGYRAYVDTLLPMVTLLTPNIPEAQQLTGEEIKTEDEMARAACQVAALMRPTQASSVLLTGGHLPGPYVTNVLFDGKNGESELTFHRTPRVLGPGFHGTGCALASAIATGLAHRHAMQEAVQTGLAFVHRAIAESFVLGKGQKMLRLNGSHHEL